ncbi:MAG: AI-2E family transporter [Candidatus Promineifilaceae bacterium]|nr:AI-2E family transporter [Candidatus Promineifilaceae bacterium]
MEQQPSQSTRWSPSTRRTVAVLMVIFIIFVIWVVQPAIPSLIIAGLLAFILAPLVKLLHRRLRLPRGLAIPIAYLVLIVVLVLLPLLVVPALARSFAILSIDLSVVGRTIQEWLIATLESFRTVDFVGLSFDLSRAIDPALEAVQEISLGSVTPSFDEILGALPRTIELTVSVVGGVFAVLAAILLTFIYSIYMSVDASRIGSGFWGFVPPEYLPEMRRLARRINKMWSAFVRGQLTLAFIIFLLTWILGTAIGLPGAFALGVLAGSLEIIPNVGPLLAAIPAVLVAFIQGSLVLDVTNGTFGLIVIGMYVIIQQLENQLIVPRVLGDAVELPSLVVLVSVVVGFQVGGILGALIAAPTVATVREVFFYSLNKVLGREPFPPQHTEQPGEASTLERVRDAWRQARQWAFPPSAGPQDAAAPSDAAPPADVVVPAEAATSSEAATSTEAAASTEAVAQSDDNPAGGAGG